MVHATSRATIVLLLMRCGPAIGGLLRLVPKRKPRGHRDKTKVRTDAFGARRRQSRGGRGSVSHGSVGRISSVVVFCGVWRGGEPNPAPGRLAGVRGGLAVVAVWRSPCADGSDWLRGGSRIV